MSKKWLNPPKLCIACGKGIIHGATKVCGYCGYRDIINYNLKDRSEKLKILMTCTCGAPLTWKEINRFCKFVCYKCQKEYEYAKRLH